MFECIYRKPTWRMFLAASLAFGLTLPALESVRANSTDGGNSNRGWPTRRVGGGSRTGCPLTARPCSPLLALVPAGLLQTASHAPTFLFYVPSIEKPEKVQIELVLRDEDDRLVYERTFTTNGEEGILEIAIAPSKTFLGLETDRSYQWYLSIIRDPADRSRDEMVGGWVKRVPSSGEMARQMETLAPLERVKRYESEQLWPEALSELIRLKRARPGDVQVSLMWRETIAALQLPLSLEATIGDNPNLSTAPNF